MHQNAQFMTREQFCKELNLSLGTERRLRQAGQDWPPHLRIGRKIFYRRDGVRQWVARKEVAAPGIGSAASLTVLTPDQITWLQNFFGSLSGDAA